MSSEFAAYRRGSIMGQRMGVLTIDPSYFEAIENYIQWCRLVPKRFPGAMNHLVRTMALVHIGYAQAYSLGPVDPRQQNPSAAWKLPVRRISGRYFFGWKVRRVSNGVWQSYNDSREAFYIEFGIHRNPATGNVSARRIRRPVNKLAMQRLLRFLSTTTVAHRVWADIYFPPPGMRVGKGYLWTMQSPPVQQAMFPRFSGSGVGMNLNETPISQ